jgi:glucosamine kinase
MHKKIKFLIGVDGGGSGTRIIISDTQGKIISKGTGGPSALSLGIKLSWKMIIETISKSFAELNLEVPMFSECAIGLGLSGANNIAWKNEFLLYNPGFQKIILDTDGYTTLTGAHNGEHGLIVALGTGSIGMAKFQDGTRNFVSGWGFPSGDEASGSWLGLLAVRLLEKTIDGRRVHSPLTLEIEKQCGKNADELLSWLSTANQNTFAQLAPAIFKTAETDKESNVLLKKAGLEVLDMVKALDPNNLLPFSICGRLGEVLIPYLPEQLQNQTIPPFGDSAYGAYLLIKAQMK